MKHSLSFISLLLLLGVLCSFMETGTQTYTLETALAKKIVRIQEISSAEGGTDLRLKLENLKKQDVKIQIESGTQFLSRDTSEQDVITIEEKMLLVKAGQSASLKLIGYCTEARMRSPMKGSAFELKSIAAGAENPKLKKLAEFLRADKQIDSYLYQHAVWVVTNDHDLRGLHHENPEKAIAMQKFVSDLTGKPMPKYTVRYDDGRVGEVAFTGVMVMIFGNFEYDLDKDCSMTLEVFNEAGEMVQTVFKDHIHKRGHSKFQFKLKARDLPPGKYTSKLFKDGELFQTMEVETI